MLDYRLMTIDDYEAAYDLWIRCGLFTVISRRQNHYFVCAFLCYND